MDQGRHGVLESEQKSVGTGSLMSIDAELEVTKVDYHHHVGRKQHSHKAAHSTKESEIFLSPFGADVQSQVAERLEVVAE